MCIRDRIQPAPTNSGQTTKPKQQLPSYLPPPEVQPSDFGSDDIFGEITHNDLSGVKAVSSPGHAAPGSSGGHSAHSLDAHSEEPSKVDSDGAFAKKLIGFLGGFIFVAGGAGLIIWYVGFAADSEDEDGVRFRRRSPIGIGIGLIVTGLGWMGGALGIYSKG